MRATQLVVVCGVVSVLSVGCGSGGAAPEGAAAGSGAEATARRRPRRPAAPTGLGATVSGGVVRLSWSAVAGATGYRVYRTPSAASSYLELTASPQPGTAYADAAVSPGSTYWYEVRASNTAGTSAPSTPASATVPTGSAQTVQVTVSPGAGTVDGCATLQLSAVVTGTASTGVTWSVQEGAAGGAVSGAGLYTAPAAAGTYHVVAASSASPSATGTATLTVRDHVLSVSVTPALATVAPGGTQRFTATVTTTCGTFAAP
jgi:chitinase